MKRTALKRNQKPIRRKALGRPPLKDISSLSKRATSDELNEMFLRIWKALRPDQRLCYETGERLYVDSSNGLPLTTYFHHVLAKEIYPQFALSPWNIVLVLPRIHSDYETSPKSCPKIYSLYLEYKSKSSTLEP